MDKHIDTDALVAMGWETGVDADASDDFEARIMGLDEDGDDYWQ